MKLITCDLLVSTTISRTLNIQPEFCLSFSTLSPSSVKHFDIDLQKKKKKRQKEKKKKILIPATLISSERVQ